MEIITFLTPAGSCQGFLQQDGFGHESTGLGYDMMWCGLIQAWEPNGMMWCGLIEGL